MAKRKGRKKARTAAQKRATAKMLRAAKAARRSKGRVAAPRKRRRKARKSHAAPRRRKARRTARKAPKRRRKARRRAAEEWRGDSAGHARAARKGWRKRKARKSGRRKSAGRKRQTAKQRAASLRNLRKARAARRGHGRSRAKPRKRSATRRRARRAAGTAHRASHAITPHKGPGLSSYGRRRRARRNPSQYGLTGGELFVASIFGTLGFLGGDALDRFIATHALTDKGTKDANGNELYADNPPTTGNYTGLFNPTAICAPMDLGRWAAGIGVPAAMFVTANFVKAPMVRASMQFAAFGWGVRVVGKGAIDAIATLTKGMGTGQRLYDGEMRAAVLKANNGNQQATDLASLPSAGLGRPQLGKAGAGDCAPCADKSNLGYPSMPREVNQQNASTPAPPVQMTAPPPPPPPAAPPPNLNMQNLTGVPKNGGRNRFNWGHNDE